MWAPIYGAILNIEFFQPLAALVKSADGLSFFASENGILFVSIVTIILTSALVALGMAGYARIQKWCLYLGLIGFAIMVVLMLVSSQADFKVAFDRANQSMFGVAGAYDKTLADAAVNDAWVTTLAPTDMGANLSRHAARDARHDPVHAVLDPLPELGLDAVRRGPRLG